MAQQSARASRARGALANGDRPETVCRCDHSAAARAATLERIRSRVCDRALLRRPAQPDAARFLDRSAALRSARSRLPRSPAARALSTLLSSARRATPPFSKRSSSRPRQNRSLDQWCAPNGAAQVRRLGDCGRTAEPLATRCSHPQFLVDRWTQAIRRREAAVALCEWNNQPAPIYARINQLKISARGVRRDIIRTTERSCRRGQTSCA